MKQNSKVSVPDSKSVNLKALTMITVNFSQYGALAVTLTCCWGQVEHPNHDQS